jgi:ribosomal protein S18 acetylase RimI-like enzyme
MEASTASDAGVLSLLRTLEAKTAVACEAGRDTTAVGPFLATVHRTNDLMWLSYALPISERRDEPVTAETIRRLREVFAERGRVLRFEFFEPLWPNLAADLERHGLMQHAAMPIMICSKSELRPARAAGVVVHALSPDDADDTLRRFHATSKAAFEELGGANADVTAAEVHKLRENLRGGVYRSAWASIAGQIAGVGSIGVVNDELLGIGTLPAFRRRGVAATISSHLLLDHLRNDAQLAWLSASDDAAYATYAKIGFHPVGMQLNYRDGARDQGSGVRSQKDSTSALIPDS